MKFKFDRTKFLAGITPTLGKLTPSQLRGLTFLLGRIENDSTFTTIPQIAYFLASIWHETAKRLSPVTEFGPRSYFRKYDTGRLAARLGNTPEADGDGFKFRGHGLLQNTGLANALRSGAALKGREYLSPDGGAFVVDELTFARNPELLLIPEVSYDDAVDAMFTGRYTGKQIDWYINAETKDYVGARRVINGTDRAMLIAGYALAFEAALQASLIEFEIEKTVIDETKEERKEATTISVPENKTEISTEKGDGKVTIKDVAKHIDPATARSIGPRLATKVGTWLFGWVATLWSLGLHGKILAVAILVVIAGAIGFGIYEVVKHRRTIKRAVVEYIKGGGGK